jgi:hypothetical protein
MVVLGPIESVESRRMPPCVVTPVGCGIVVRVQTKRRRSGFYKLKNWSTVKISLFEIHEVTHLGSATMLPESKKQ